MIILRVVVFLAKYTIISISFRFCTELDSSLVTLYMQLMCEFCDEIEVLRFVQTHKNLQLEPALKVRRESTNDRFQALKYILICNYLVSSLQKNTNYTE